MNNHQDTIVTRNGAILKTNSTVRKLFPYVLLVIFLSLSVWIWQYFENLVTQKEQRRFDRNVAECIEKITNRLDRYKIILQDAASIFLVERDVSRAEWRNYVEYRLVQMHRFEFLAMGMAQVVWPAELAQHIRSIRAKGFPDYTVRPEGEREVYTPVIFVEPFTERLRRLIGYDMSSESTRRTAMNRARDTGECSLTGKVTLDQENGENIQPGFLLYVPVYAKGMPVNSPEEWQAAITGYVFVVFRINDFIKSIFPQFDRELDFNIYDGAGISPETLLYESRVELGATDPHPKRKPMFAVTQTLGLYGHPWTLTFQSKSGFVDDADVLHPYIILCAGMIISLLAFFILNHLERTNVSAISLAHKMTAALRASEEKFRLAMSNSPVGMVLADTDGRFFEVNKALCKMLGYSKKELLQSTIKAIVHPDHVDSILQSVRQMMEGKIATFRAEIPYIHKDGHIVWTLMAVSLIEEKDGSKDDIIGQILDITKQKQLEQEHIARKAAEEASRQKSRFVSNMSHEIRTPMNGVLGFAQILERDPSLTPRQADQVRSIVRCGNHLLKLINDILDISKIDAGRVKLKSNAFSLMDLLDDLEMMFRSRAYAKHLHLIVDRDEALSPYVLCDEGKLRQILINLLGNALKFTESGGVALRVRSEPVQGRPEGDARSLRLVFEVEDSGPGISASDLDRIFDEFSQGEAGAVAGGTGLGLAISRKFVEMMGGRLTVESVVGKGSIFRLDILCEPIEALSEKARQNQSRRVVGLQPGTDPLRILVVDDFDVNRDLLHALLLPLGVDFRDAGNGREALKIFEEWSPHAVLMDMRMPVMDGYEATRRIKATEAGRNTPIIAVTASAFKDSEELIFEAGVSAYIRKPFRPEEFYEVLGKCLDLRYVYDDVSASASKHPRPTVLKPEALSAIPCELLQAMQIAVVEGDIDRLEEMIGKVESFDSTVALGLKALADSFDYATLKKLLGKGENNDGG